MVKCPRCGGEMREGEAFVVVTRPGSQASTFGTMGIPIGVPGMGVPAIETMREENIQWREKTGRKTGRIIKSNEEKTMKIIGRRCTQCGYIEFYAQE